MPSRVAAAVLLFSTVLPAQLKLTDFPLTTPGAFAYDIASGPDGNLWLAEYVPGVGDKGAHDHHRERSQRSLFRRECRVDRNDGGIGPKSVVFDVRSTQIGRMTASGTVTMFDLPKPNSYPAAITKGPDSNLWFVEGIANQIGRITPSGVITGFAIPTGPDSPPVALTTDRMATSGLPRPGRTRSVESRPPA